MSEDPEELNGDEKPPPRRTGPRRLLPTGRTLLGATAVVLLAGAGTLIAGYALVEIPEPNSTAAAQNNVYLYSDGTQLARDGDINRQNVELDDVPESVRRAVLAAEDRDFYHQPAVDVKAMIRAGWNMLRGEGKQSGSTITQQYVKNYYLGQEQTLTRKTKEFFIALKLDREVGKDEILAGYLNTSYFGRHAYGVQAAAQAYYGKDAGDLTTAEGAYLAALLNSPNLYDVAAHPENRERAVARWNYVLGGMVKEGWLTPRERAAAEFPEPDPAKPPTGLSGQRGYLVEAVKHHLVARDVLSEERLAQGGFRITTTIDRRKQEALVEAVERELISQLSEEREVDRHVRAGGTSIDPDTGEVVAMYGGVDYTRQFVNNATRRDYQPGSTFKPFVYAAALEHRARTRGGDLIGPNTTYEGDSGRTVIGPDGPTTWKPENEDQVDYGDITVSKAMDKSVNAVFAQMGVDVGPAKVKETAIRLGLPDTTPGMAEAQGSVSLGTSTPSTLDMAQAYASLANHGERVDHTLVKEIRHGGERVRIPESATLRAVSRATADATTAVLRGVVRNGTATAAQAAGRPAAGKTGTAEEDRAAWFAGYTPDLATVVAVMGQDPETGVHKSLYGAAGLARVNGGGIPARIWAAYTAQALRDTPVKDFELKPGGKDRVPKASPDPSGSASPDASDAPDEDPTQVGDRGDAPDASGSPGPGRDDAGNAADGEDTPDDGANGRPGPGETRKAPQESGAPGKSDGKSGEHGKSDGKAREKTAERPTQKSAQKSTEKPAGKPADRTARPPAERGDGRNPAGSSPPPSAGNSPGPRPEASSGASRTPRP
ncbi:transglycosylase domain-containing protein [Streptomyces sp. DH37]|uniref:transglycosylase domain-containing protein n=1 Tax=Streptomyces sp. DH37 TaxID=3040122 RepID=UPI002442CB74|nr:transglycosylase domain-containing protein [Streptomyces sp. DH37]MDG9704241.1 transglycosylase domain-containing protein [Streptomyces sp. DH37]